MSKYFYSLQESFVLCGHIINQSVMKICSTEAEKAGTHNRGQEI